MIQNIFLGGVYTSSVTMVWAMSELVKNSRVMNKVQMEIRTLPGNNPKVKGDGVENLEYLKMVLKETLRVHLVAPLLIPHETIRHYKINGYDLFPQTRILVNAWAIGRDPEKWKNLDEFYPTRFDGSEGQHFEFIPFEVARRICPGITMSITTMDLTLANLLYCFDWEQPNDVRRASLSCTREV